jgi:capsid protein
MSIISKIRKIGQVLAGNEVSPPAPPAQRQVMAYRDGFTTIMSYSFDGEKNMGDAGPAIDYVVDYNTLRVRAWQLFLESEICQMIIKRKTRWVIGNGLKLQAEPQREILEGDNIKIDTQSFNKQVEQRFRLYANSSMADYAGMKTLNEIADTVFTNANVGGDVLVIIRLVNNVPKIQVIDGCHLINPVNTGYYRGERTAPVTNNIIRNGIEIDDTGRHIAYWIRTCDYKAERVPAYGKSGLRIAFLVQGGKYRLDHVRGIPAISQVIESIKKLERYKEATIGSAEERQKVAWFIKHGPASTGEPVLNGVLKANGTELPTTSDGKQVVNNIYATTNKTVHDLPLDTEMQALESKNELYFKEFYNVNVELICAAIDIPPNVAMGKYDSNFSASRAALKDWEHTLMVERRKFADQFYQLIYVYWLEVQILMGKIDAPGYLRAVLQGNEMILTAYRNARWVGSNVPHIDPEKEVRAIRLMLGNDDAPLITHEAAAETLNTGDFGAIMEQYADELKRLQQAGIEVTQGNKPNTPQNETTKP